MSDLLHRRELFVGGRWVPPAGGEHVDVISPSTEAPVGEVPLATPADIDAAVAAARDAFEHGPWPAMTPDERADVLDRAAELLRKREDDIAAVTTDEMGCAASQARQAQTGLVAPVFAYYAQLVRSFELERTVTTADRKGLVTSVPVGVVAAIVPWNAPVTLAAWKVAPALAAGCTVVVKPAPEAPLSNFVLAEALEEAGVPPGVVSVVPGDRDVGEHLVTHPEVDKVAFTGSTAAGKRTMARCAESMKRVSLELGGTSAALVLDDADLAAAVPRIVGGGMHLSGQVCGAHTRVLVARSRYDEALDAAAAAARQVPYGDPHDPATVVGPLVAERQRARVEGYIASAVAEGVRVVAGGKRPSHLPKGWYVPPTVLGDVDNAMRVAREEIFGPVLSFIAVDDEDDAVRVADGVLAADIDGRPITDEEINGVILLLILGGLDTTAGALGQFMIRFTREPEIPALLRSDPSLIPGAVEELLRLEPPFIAIARTATCDTEIAGQAIAEGDKVLIYWAAANRDPAEFGCPADFDLQRDANRHLAFGAGPHRCAGSNLARMNLRIALEELVTRLHDVRLQDGVEPLPFHSALNRAPLTVPITFTPGPRLRPAEPAVAP